MADNSGYRIISTRKRKKDLNFGGDYVGYSGTEIELSMDCY